MPLRRLRVCILPYSISLLLLSLSIDTPALFFRIVLPLLPSEKQPCQRKLRSNCGGINLAACVFFLFLFADLLVLVYQGEFGTIDGAGRPHDFCPAPGATFVTVAAACIYAGCPNTPPYPIPGGVSVDLYDIREAVFDAPQ